MDHVIDLDKARARQQATVLLQVINARADGEVHRQIGITDDATFEQLRSVLTIAFALPAEDAPWGFRDGTGRRIGPTHRLGEFLREPADQVSFTWGLWEFAVVVADVYPRDEDTPWALCVGGSGSFDKPFSITDINVALTGAKKTAEVLQSAKPAVRSVVQRSQLFDFIALLQAMDLEKPTPACPDLPAEVTMQAQDIYWAYVLALACLGDAEVTASVLESTVAALGWTHEDGRPLSAADALSYIPESLSTLRRMGACGPQAAAPVDRLDIYRALLRN